MVGAPYQIVILSWSWQSWQWRGQVMESYKKSSAAAGIPHAQTEEQLQDLRQTMRLAKVTRVESMLMDALMEGGHEGAAVCQVQFENIMHDGLSTDDVHPQIVAKAQDLITGSLG